MTQFVEPTFTLLALCARARTHPAQSALVQEHAARLQHWEQIPTRAEAHGLVPLVINHLAAAGVSAPPQVKDQLLGYYMQHAHATRVRTHVLADMLRILAAAGIPALVLKGAALSQLVYPQPQLRPMRDIDILVPAEEVYRAYALLPEIGFNPPPGAHYGLGPDHHHLTAIKRVQDDFSVSVEVHHALHLNERGDPLRFAAYAPTAQHFSVHGVAAQTLGREDTLWHIYRHAFCMPLEYEPLRLIWAADLISLVEAWIDLIDWERVRRVYPAAWHSLPLLHSFSPWSSTVLERLQLMVEHLPDGAGAQYQGWPRYTLAEQRNKGWRKTLRDSVFPAPWWLHIWYGAPPTRRGYWQAWLAHQRWLAERSSAVLRRSVSN